MRREREKEEEFIKAAERDDGRRSGTNERKMFFMALVINR